MRVLLTGSTGQLGLALRRSVPKNIDLIYPTRQQLDLSKPESFEEFIDYCRPDWILNAGAYTSVDLAENNSDECFSINAQALQTFSKLLYGSGAKILQISTDYVFDGTKGSPYKTSDLTNPKNQYGYSKAMAEETVLSLPGSKVLRTSWVYGPEGNNFCLKMLKLHRAKFEDNSPLHVVVDQVGSPTSTNTLSNICWLMLLNECPDVLHWTDAGCASWYDFSIAIGEISLELGLLEGKASVVPVKSSDFPSIAKRPSFSSLDCFLTYKSFNLTPSHWKYELYQVLNAVKEGRLCSL